MSPQHPTAPIGAFVVQLPSKPYEPRETEDQRRHRIARDMHDLRVLAWLVQPLQP